VNLLDTSVAVDYLRGHPGTVSFLEGLVTADEILASELTRFELLAGVRDRELDALGSFCSALRWLPVDEDVTRIAGGLARRFRAAHSGIDDVDYLIAATSIHYGVALLTTNVRHYPMLAELRAPY
jgi:predicted nucleic acid-binding protein